LNVDDGAPVSIGMRPTLLVVLSLFACADPSPSPQTCYGTFLPPNVEPVVVQGHSQTVSFPLSGCDDGFADLTPHVELQGPHLPVDGTVVATHAGVDLTFSPLEAGWYDVRVQYGPKRTFQARVLAAADRTTAQPVLLEGTVADAVVTSYGGIVWTDTAGHSWFQRGAQRWPMVFGAQPIASDDVLWEASATVRRYVDPGVGPLVESPEGGIDADGGSGFFGNGGNLMFESDGALHRIYVGDDGALALDERTWPATFGDRALAPWRPEVWSAANEAGGSAERCRLDLERDSEWSCTGAGGVPLGFDARGFWFMRTSPYQLVYAPLDPVGPGDELLLTLPAGFCAFVGPGDLLPMIERCDGSDDRLFVPRVGTEDIVLEDWGLRASDGAVRLSPRAITQWGRGGVRVSMR
jgi:hypothetical protein